MQVNYLSGLKKSASGLPGVKRRCPFCAVVLEVRGGEVCDERGDCPCASTQGDVSDCSEALDLHTQEGDLTGEPGG